MLSKNRPGLHKGWRHICKQAILDFKIEKGTGLVLVSSYKEILEMWTAFIFSMWNLLIPNMLSANRAGVPVFKGRGWANCHFNPVLLLEATFGHMRNP